MMGKFEVVLPHPDERAHRPPPGFHTLYPEPSGSQLLQLPASPGCPPELSRHPLDPLRLYAASPDQEGNPSSHNGWMSRFFYIKRDGKRRSHWRCDMSWRDNVYTLAPRTPERSPNLTSFLEAMLGKSYNAPELIKEDLLCFFKFSRKGVELSGDLDARIGKAEMLQFMEATEEAAAPPKKVAKKRKSSTPAEKEARRQRKKGASLSGARPEQTTEGLRGSMKESGPGWIPPLNYFEDSLVVSPTATVATKYLCHMAPHRDLDRLAGASDTEAVGLLPSPIASLVVIVPADFYAPAGSTWPPPDYEQLIQLWTFFDCSSSSSIIQNTIEMMAQLEELKAIQAQEKKAVEAVQEALRAQLASERVARATEEEALRSELEEVMVRATGRPSA
ncbi:hypothetical protein F511_36956 [Dorcoceras hygrometricum]|uniref:Uncharacterized protein n=1 Tax=Dorcoceras hygrometricum TaxID=472368 RepID=A0A2Z7BDM8_9LAMI|nr:hypothetical protein F511_36956 [Dorcoceras hygrometricum]